MIEYTVPNCQRCQHYRRYADPRVKTVEYVCCALTGGALMNQNQNCREYRPESVGGDRERD